jgi:hypothetical protein
MSDYTAAERLIASITIYPDPDEPMSYEDGIQIGCNAPRVVAALKEAGFVIFKAASFKKGPLHKCLLSACHVCVSKIIVAM